MVNSIHGARKALRDDRAQVFLYDAASARHLVDAGEWRRIGEFVSPWPSSVAIVASDAALTQHGTTLLQLLETVRSEAAALRRSPRCAATLAVMYGATDAEMADWLQGGIRWSVTPTISHAVVAQVTDQLVQAGLISEEQRKAPGDLVASVCADGIPAELNE